MKKSKKGKIEYVREKRTGDQRDNFGGRGGGGG